MVSTALASFLLKDYQGWLHGSRIHVVQPLPSAWLGGLGPGGLAEMPVFWR